MYIYNILYYHILRYDSKIPISYGNLRESYGNSSHYRKQRFICAVLVGVKLDIAV